MPGRARSACFAALAGGVAFALARLALFLAPPLPGGGPLLPAGGALWFAALAGVLAAAGAFALLKMGAESWPGWRVARAAAWGFVAARYLPPLAVFAVVKIGEWLGG